MFSLDRGHLLSLTGATERLQNHVSGAFARACRTFATTFTTSEQGCNMVLAERLTFWMQACPFVTFTRKDPSQAECYQVRYLYFEILPAKGAAPQPPQERPMIVSDADIVQQDQHRKILLPYDAERKMFFVPVDGKARIEVDYLDQKIVPYGQMKDITEALKFGGSKREALAMRAMRETARLAELADHSLLDINPAFVPPVRDTRSEQRFKQIQQKAMERARG